MVQDLFPLVPGTFKVSLLLKNEASKEFCSFERTIAVPAPTPESESRRPFSDTRPSRPTRSGKPSSRSSSAQTRSISSRTGRSPGRTSLVLAFQVLGLDGETRPKARLRFEITRDAQPVKSWERDVSGFPDLPFVVESLPAADFLRPSMP